MQSLALKHHDGSRGWLGPTQCPSPNFKVCTPGSVKKRLKLKKYNSHPQYPQRGCVYGPLLLLLLLLPKIPKFSNAQVLLYKMSSYLLITNAHSPLQFQPSLDYLSYLIQCECYVNSCNKQKIQLLHFRTFWKFFPPVD